MLPPAPCHLAWHEYRATRDYAPDLRTNLASEATGWATRPASRPGRSLITYLAVIAVDVWLVLVLMDLQMDRTIGQAIASSARALSPSGLVVVVLVAIGFVPGLVLSMELAARRPPPSLLGRMLGGAIAWGAWSAIVALSATSLSGLVLFEMSIFAGFLLFALSGAVFGWLGLDREARPPGRAVISLALIAATIVIIGSFLTRGLWGGPA